MLHKPFYFSILTAYILLMALLMRRVRNSAAHDFLSDILSRANYVLVLVYSLLGLMLLIIAFGYPRGARAAAKALARAGIVNSTGEAPMLLTVSRDKDNSKLMRYEFDATDLPPSYWEEHQSEIEAALNVSIVKMRCSRGKQRVWVICVPAIDALPDYL